MSALLDLQKKFLAGVLSGDDSILAHVRGEGGITAAQRLQVYRNNAFVILADRLREGFPATAALGGDAFFTSLAHAFIRAHPPTCGDVNLYGTGLPAFMRGEAALKATPFLADVAELEWLRQEAYMAADTGEGLLSPSLRLFASPWPVIRLWQLGMKQIKVGEVGIHDGGENAVIFRDHDGIAMWTVEDDAFAFITGLAAGGDVEVPEGFDAATCLRRLADAGLTQQKGNAP